VIAAKKLTVYWDNLTDESWKAGTRKVNCNLAALLPTALPKRMKHVDVAACFEPARGLGGDLYDFLAPEPNTLAVAVGDVSGKGVAASLFAASTRKRAQKALP